MGDSLPTIDMGRKLEAVHFFWGGGGAVSPSSRLTQCGWAEAYTSAPNGILIHPAVWPQYMGRKAGAAVPPFGAGIRWVPI